MMNKNEVIKRGFKDSFYLNANFGRLIAGDSNNRWTE